MRYFLLIILSVLFIFHFVICDSGRELRQSRYYVSSTGNDFSLQEGSPAIDAGIDLGYGWIFLINQYLVEKLRILEHLKDNNNKPNFNP